MKPIFRRPLALSTLIAALAAPAGNAATMGQHTGNGGDTYVSQLDEARLVATELFTANTALPAGPGDRLGTTYASYRVKWLDALKGFAITRSTETLKDLDGDGRPKAALAVPALRQVRLSVPYWEANPVTLFQAVVLAIHESGHIARVPLTHEELDQIGRALALSRYRESLGQMVLQEIVRRDPTASRYQVMKDFYETSTEPLDIARLPQKRSYDSPPHTCAFLMEDEGNGPYSEDRLRNRRFSLLHETVPAQPAPAVSPFGPLFPEKPTPASEQVALLTHTQIAYVAWRLTARDLILNLNEFLTDEDKTTREVDSEFHFRQNEDLFAFAVTQYESQTPEHPGYGYCWKQ